MLETILLCLLVIISGTLYLMKYLNTETLSEFEDEYDKAVSIQENRKQIKSIKGGDS